MSKHDEHEDATAAEAASQGRKRTASRRTWLLAAVAGTAACAGTMLAWRRHSSAGPASDPQEALWKLAFSTPTGDTLAMSSLRGKPLIVNFWATWCPPCVEELPMLDSFYRQHAARGWQVVGLAVDQPAAVSMFLDRRPVSFPIAMAGLAGTSLARDLGNQQGGLPYTLVFDSAGGILGRKMGQLLQEDLDRWARE